jgi:hypothetical protein
MPDPSLSDSYEAALERAAPEHVYLSLVLRLADLHRVAARLLEWAAKSLPLPPTLIMKLVSTLLLGLRYSFSSRPGRGN